MSADIKAKWEDAISKIDWRRNLTAYMREAYYPLFEPEKPMKLTLKVGEDTELRGQIMTLIKQGMEGLARKDAREILVEEAKRVIANTNIKEIVKDALIASMRYDTVRHDTGKRTSWTDWVIGATVDAIKAFVDSLGTDVLQKTVNEAVRYRVQQLSIDELTKDLDARADKAVRDALRRALTPQG